MIETSEDIIKDSESPHLSVLPGLACGSSFEWEKLTSVVPNTAPRLTIFKASQEEGSGVGTESMDENSVFSAQFCCEVKSALKNSLFKKK